MRRRILAEPRVRFWWLAGCVLGAMGVALVIGGLRTRAHEAWLIDDGVLLNSNVYFANGESVKNRPQPPDSSVQIRFTWHGNPYGPQARFLPGRHEPIVTGSTLPVHVNPENPEDWTWLAEPMPLFTHVLSGAITLPIAVLALAVAWLVYWRTLRVWREGEARQALVVDGRTTALAPFSRALRVTLADEADPRIFTVYVPRRLSSLSPGDTIWIIRHDQIRGSTLAAAWFE
ncbi:MAG TPA: DUF3592 domain-containing protein [Tepidisphaeraceae bacterium]|nr:DUF3592 domain-containing protein [Tepidisphaeraceae bacterium]